MQQKDEETNLINQKINNINSLVSENINNIKNDLSHKDEEIEWLKKSSANLENELEQNNKELEKNSNDINILNDKLNDIEVISNKNSDEIQNIKNLESNLALLVDFKIKVKIKAYFNIEDQQANLCSHKPYDKDVINDSKVRLNAFKWRFGGCVWILHQNGKYFEFALTDSSYDMNNWKIRISNNEVFCTNSEMSSIFILEEGTINRYYKIKDNETRQYLFINQDNQRDRQSYFIDLTTNKDLATDFYFEIYHEE